MHPAILSLLLLIAAQGGCAAKETAAAEETRSPLPKPAPFEGDLASFKITNDNPTALSERVVSFGQIFPAGRVQPNTRLTVTLNASAVPSQMDVKAMYPDGSVRHAIIAARAPRLVGGASVEGLIKADGADDRGALPATPPAVPAIQVAITHKAGAVTIGTAYVDLPALARAPSSRKPPPWLKGPLVQEQRYHSAMIGGLQVVFDVWTSAVGPSRVDVIFHNDSAQNATIGTQIYDAAINLDGHEVYRADNVNHHRYQTWHKALYTDGARPPRVTPDTKLLIAVGAVPHYAQVRPDASQMSNLHKAAIQGGPPLGYVANLTPYMPTTGGRADIGPLPAWAAFFVLDPSKQNYETLFANADVAGFIPWHVRDMQTDGPINMEKHPTVWLDYRGKAAPGILNRQYETEDGTWAIDDAHQPSLTYLPYLLTGSQYYRDELAMQAGYNLLSINPEYRGQGAGNVLGSQIRAVAWDLRTLANAAYILPHDDPLQAYFQSKLEFNLREMVRRYVKGDELSGAGELRGYVPGPNRVEGSIPPWQEDYLVIVLGWIDSMGFSDARPTIAWMTNFVAGRFTNADRGYNPIYGTPYNLYVADPHSQQLLNSWSRAFQATFDTVSAPVTTLDNPDWGGGYAALARAALASIINATGSPQAEAAYAFVKINTPRMDASYPSEPSFAIAPRTSQER
jgi:hypothetical protein